MSLVQTKQRIYSIDILRGLVMIIMPLDHARDFFHANAFTQDPLDLDTTTPFLFFTRWITHFCAPVFVFLAGTSAFLQSRRKSKQELSVFLLKRGLWLIFIELAVITLGWTFNLNYNLLIFQVIWAIGISMVLLAFIIRLPFNIILATGLVIVFGHNLLDQASIMKSENSSLFFDLFFKGNFSVEIISANLSLLIIYPAIQWAGVMMCGYCFGRIYNPEVKPEKRKQVLLWSGWLLILFFIIIRFINIYGDPHQWENEKNAAYTFMSFINVTKYPPSLLFLSITLGPAFLLLALLEHVNNRLSKFISTFGRVPFFYYVLHFYLLHVICVILFLSRGHSWSEGVNGDPGFPFRFVVPGEGYGLGVVYAIWIGVVLLLYPLCAWFNRIKNRNKSVWMSYL